MHAQHAALLARVNAFTLDEPGSSLTFTERLAKENGWSSGYARRVVTEYKRFAFLAVAAGHPVSPSDAVDQAWHLHLVYTKSYWQSFCAKVLCTPLHHEPTRGGSGERTKFSDWYEKTLASYRQFFGEIPPADIWPTGAQRAKTHEEFRRVDCARYWVVRKPGAVIAATACACVVALIAAGCVPQLGAGVPLFDMRGPEFLAFFAFAAPIGFLLAAMARHRFREPLTTERGSAPPEDPYVIAALAGGPVQVVNTALVALAQQHAITISNDSPPFIQRKNGLGDKPHPVEAHIYENLGVEGDRIGIVRQRFHRMADELRAALERRGWVLGREQMMRARLVPFAIASVVPLLGLIKIMVGLSRARPVGYLVGLVLLSVFLAAIIFLRRVWRTALGDDILAQMRAGFCRPERAENEADVVIQAMSLGVALYGLSELEGTAQAHLRKQLTPPKAAESGAATCGGDTSGTSGCGGGGGDGGGAGCGGGCGGCGGGH